MADIDLRTLIAEGRALLAAVDASAGLDDKAYEAWDEWLHEYAATLLDALEAAEADRERLHKIGVLLPIILEALPWGAFKAALMEDGDLRAAIDAARKGEP